MTPVIPSAWPSYFYTGDTVKVYRSFADYPASEGWALAVSLAGPSATLTVNGVADVDRWLVTLTAAQTAGLAAGTYRLLERVSKAGEVFTAGDGRIEARVNLATVAAGTGQSHAEKTLAQIDALLATSWTSDIVEYSIAGRAVKRYSRMDLTNLRARYAAMVYRERTGKIGRTVEVEFA